jgi:hypothetical protein
MNGVSSGSNKNNAAIPAAAIAVSMPSASQRLPRTMPRNSAGSPCSR